MLSWVKNELSDWVAVKEINDVESPRIVEERMAQNWFRRFKEDDTIIKDKSMKRKPLVVEDEAFLEIVEQQPSTNNRKLLSEFAPTKSTINWHLQTLKYLKYEIA